MNNKDCRYCEHAATESANSNWCSCYVDDGYFDHKIEDFREANTCKWFEYSDSFPKY